MFKYQYPIEDFSYIIVLMLDDNHLIIFLIFIFNDKSIIIHKYNYTSRNGKLRTRWEIQHVNDSNYIDIAISTSCKMVSGLYIRFCVVNNTTYTVSFDANSNEEVLFFTHSPLGLALSERECTEETRTKKIKRSKHSHAIVLRKPSIHKPSCAPRVAGGSRSTCAPLNKISLTNHSPRFLNHGKSSDKLSVFVLCLRKIPIFSL